MTSNWTRDQLVLAFELYCRTPFGRMHQHNPDIIALAGQLGRTASAVAMKLSNFASLDPAEHTRGIRGLSGASRLDREIFGEFARRQDALLDASEAAARALGVAPPPASDPEALQQEVEEVIALVGPTETERVMRVRRVQGAFRRAVLASYDSQCAMCRLAIPAMLSASHIIPWRRDESRRADPTNGLALCALHDRAFDRGLIAVNADMHLVVSPRVHAEKPPAVHQIGLLDIASQPLYLPRRFHPDSNALAYHRERVFRTA